MALSALLAPEESLMEKEALARVIGRAVRGFRPNANHLRKTVMRQPGPSFRDGATNVGQGFRELGDSVVQRGKNLQAGANAADAIGTGVGAAGQVGHGSQRGVGDFERIFRDAVLGGNAAPGVAVRELGKTGIREKILKNLVPAAVGGSAGAAAGAGLSRAALKE